MKNNGALTQSVFWAMITPQPYTLKSIENKGGFCFTNPNPCGALILRLCPDTMRIPSNQYNLTQSNKQT